MIAWTVIDAITDQLCRWSFHDWSEWDPNTYSGRVWIDWTRQCERCSKLEWAVGYTSPSGTPHPGDKY